LFTSRASKKRVTGIRASADSLQVVQVILNGVKVGQRLPLPVRPSSDPTGPKELHVQSVWDHRDGALDNSFSPPLEGSSGHPMQTPLHVVSFAPKFTSEVDGLHYLSQHATRCIKHMKFAEQTASISRPYLIELLTKLASHAMLNDAKSLMAVMKLSTHFQPPLYLEEYFDSLVSADQTGNSIEYMKQYQSKHGKIPDSLLIKLVEPYIMTQQWESVEEIFGSLAQPSTVASNLLLKSFVSNRLITKAKSTFHQLLELNQTTSGKFGADSNTFTIMMDHFANEGDLKQLGSLMRNLLNTPSIVIKPIHFELFFETFAKRQEWGAIVNMARIMINKGITQISEQAATHALWAYIHTRQTSLGLNLHRHLTNPALSTSIPYLQALHICFSTVKPSFDRDYSVELQRIASKISSLEMALNDSEHEMTERKGEKSKLNVPLRKNPRVDYGALQDFIATEIDVKPFPLARLKEIVTVYCTDQAALFKLLKALLESHGRETPVEACVSILNFMKEPQQLSTVLSWIDEASVPLHPDILIHRLRSHWLSSQSPLQTQATQDKIHKQLERTLSDFHRSSSTPLTWEALKFILRTYYQLQKGQLALAILEPRLPTLQELFTAPSQAFLPPSSFATKKLTPKDSKRNATMDPGSRTLETAQIDNFQRFRVPVYVALDFYAWCLSSDFSVLNRTKIYDEYQSIAALGEEANLTASQLKTLLSHLQLIRRMPALQPTAKDGWKSRYIKRSL
jgi:hypothetical protein